MLAASLALLTSLCYGVSNFAGPRISRGLPTFAVLIAGQVVAFSASAAVLVATTAELPRTTVLVAAAGAGVGNAWGLIAFYKAASLGPLSIVTPIGALAALVPVTVGVASGESLGAVKLLGLVLALGGVAVAARRPVAHAPRGDTRGAVVWALASTIGFGAFLALVKPASVDGVFWAVAASRVALLVAMAAAVVALSAPVRAPLRRLPVVAVPGTLLFAGTLAYSAATREGDLSVVSVLSSLFPVFTVGLAFAGGERVTRVQAFGVAAALAGIVLVSAAGT